MVETTKLEQLGFRQAKQICGMAAKRRMEFIAEGLPIIFQSAQSLLLAKRKLKEFPRETEVLEGHCIEECAKILILVDLIRCPAKLVASRLGNILTWFYGHLPRLIYADAQNWIAYSPEMLQGYVDDYRKTHYLEGYCGEWIVPNWELYRRESNLYADVVGNEDAEPSWHSPLPAVPDYFPDLAPAAYKVADALEAVGTFTPLGLRIVASEWGQLDFSVDRPEWSDPRSIVRRMLERLEAEGLITPRAENDHVETLQRHWQKPMYFIDFSPLPVTLEELRRQRKVENISEFM